MVYEVLSGGVRGVIMWCKRYYHMVSELLSGGVRGIVRYCNRSNTMV